MEPTYSFVRSHVFVISQILLLWCGIVPSSVWQLFSQCIHETRCQYYSCCHSSIMPSLSPHKINKYWFFNYSPFLLVVDCHITTPLIENWWSTSLSFFLSLCFPCSITHPLTRSIDYPYWLPFAISQYRLLSLSLSLPRRHNHPIKRNYVRWWTKEWSIIHVWLLSAE